MQRQFFRKFVICAILWSQTPSDLLINPWRDVSRTKKYTFASKKTKRSHQLKIYRLLRKRVSQVRPKECQMNLKVACSYVLWQKFFRIPVSRKSSLLSYLLPFIHHSMKVDKYQMNFTDLKKQGNLNKIPDIMVVFASKFSVKVRYIFWDIR